MFDQSLGALSRAVSEFWAEYSDMVIAVSGLVLLALFALTTWAFSKSSNKAPVIDRIASILVLVWTSEGMWEVVTAKNGLDLPVHVAVVTFFFAELMIASAVMDAEAHRKKYGHPGPYARLVWLLSMLFMIVVFAGANTFVEHVFRLVVPLAAVTKWSTRLNVEWDSDTDKIKAERKERLAAREATWVHTPKSVLIRAGLMKPGTTTTTAAQREHQIQRMVQLADSIATMWSWRKGWAKRRFRKLARTLTQDMLDEVQNRLAITARALTLVEGPAGTPSAYVERVREQAEHDDEQTAEHSLSSAEHERREHSLSAPLAPAEHAAEHAAERAQHRAREQAERPARVPSEQINERAAQPAALTAERQVGKSVSIPEQSEPTGPVSDEEAVQRMLDHTKDPDHRWTWRSAAGVAGVAQSRGGKLIARWTEHVTRAQPSGSPSNAEQAGEHDAEQAGEHSLSALLSKAEQTAEQATERDAERSLSATVSTGTDGAELTVSTPPGAAPRHVNGTTVAAR